MLNEFSLWGRHDADSSVQTNESQSEWSSERLLFFLLLFIIFFWSHVFFFSHLFLTCSEKASSSCLFSGLVPVGFLLQAVFQDLPWNTYSEKNPLNSESKTMVYDAVAILVFLHKNKISSTRKIRPKKTAHI